MALTVAEANAVNSVLEWLLRDPTSQLEYQPNEWAAHEARVRDAAVLLAQHANDRLGAGLDGLDVKLRWSGR